MRGPVRHQPPDRAEVAGGGEPPGVDHEDRIGEPLDLLQDVGREQDGPTLGGHRPEQVDHVQALARVHAVERLVEQQDLGLVDERAGDLGTLAHALGVGADRPVGRAGQVDRGDRVPRPHAGREALEAGVQLDELAAREVDGTASRSGTSPSRR